MPDGREVVWPESPKLYWDDSDYESWNTVYGPGKWFHSPGPYNEYLEQYECVFFYVDNVYREKMTFEIEYEMSNAAFRYNDCSDLYIAMYSGETTKYLESFDAEILIPNKDMPRDGNYKAVTFGTNEGTFPFSESATKNPGYYTFSFNLSEDDLKFKSWNEYIEFDLVSYGEDKHIFTEHAPNNWYSNDNVLDEIWEEQEYYLNAPARYQKIKLTILAVCLSLSLIVVITAIGKPRKFKKRYPSYSDGDSKDIYRDIPDDLDPKFAAALVFAKEKKPEDDAGVYSAILLSLARKRYVDIQEIGTDDALIIVKEDETEEYFEYCKKLEEHQLAIQADPSLSYFEGPIKPVDTREPLSISEQYYLNLIEHHTADGYITMSTLQNRISSDYSYTANFAKNIKKSVVDNGVSLGYFQKATWLEPKILLKNAASLRYFLGGLSLFAGLIIAATPAGIAYGAPFILGATFILSGMYLKSQAHKYVLLTEFGEQEYQKWHGLYNFLTSDTLISERTVIELPLWEKYLIYATAFGIPEKVIAAIKICCPEGMYVNSIVNNTYYRSGRIHTSGRSFHRSVRTGYHGHSYSSGGFGYGGGDRGGGGH